jgi:hypothetical protein
MLNIEWLGDPGDSDLLAYGLFPNLMKDTVSPLTGNTVCFTSMIVSPAPARPLVVNPFFMDQRGTVL